MQYQSTVQKQTQTQTLKILPQQIQFLNLLNLNVLDLDAYIKQSLEENPFLERNETFDTLDQEITPFPDDDNYDTDTNDFDKTAYLNRGLDDEIADYTHQTENGYQSDEPLQLQHAEPTDFRSELKSQCDLLGISEDMRPLCHYLIDSLDDAGYLAAAVDALADDMSFASNRFISDQAMGQALQVVQKMEPAGIGARNLQECLQLQLHRHRAQGFKVDLPLLLVSDYMDELAAHHYDKIMEQLGIDEDTLDYALEYIKTLNPRPLYGFSDNTDLTPDTILPEYLVELDHEDIQVSLVNGSSEILCINEDSDLLAVAAQDKKAETFVRKKMEDARWVVDALRQRDDTMLRTIRVIATLQREFFLTGDYRKLKPMILKDVAAYAGFDISTISRVTSKKYAQTPFGIINLKDLFVHQFTTQEGQEINTQEVLDELQSIVGKEDKKNPLNDTELCQLLSQKGFAIARRTVAKYREQLQIPAAPLRKTVV